MGAERRRWPANSEEGLCSKRDCCRGCQDLYCTLRRSLLRAMSMERRMPLPVFDMLHPSPSQFPTHPETKEVTRSLGREDG